MTEAPFALLPVILYTNIDIINNSGAKNAVICMWIKNC